MKALTAARKKMTKAQATLIETIRHGLNEGCRLINFTYESKGADETAEHTLLMGIDLKKAYQRDRAVLCGKMAHLKGIKGIKRIAAQDLLDSLNDSIRNGIGNNIKYTCKGVFARIAKGIKLHIETNTLLIFGFSLRRKVLIEGFYPARKMSKLVKAKNELRKMFKCRRFRNFCLTNVISARIQGKTILLKTKKKS
jgi:hypothetical protein